jgi:hypothetical protein
MRSTSFISAAIASLAVAILAPAIASAQPSSSPPPPPGSGPGPYYGSPQPGYRVQPEQGPGGFWNRRGLTIGFGIGLGSTGNEDGPIGCFDCEYDPIAVGFDFHIGGMLTPQFALLFEAQGIAQTLDADGTTTLVQSIGTVAAQFWVTPQLWLKGGIGGAHVAVSYDDGYTAYESDGADGTAFTIAGGYEIMSARRMAIDLQLRGTVASYDGFLGDNVSTGLMQVGFNWY